MELSDKLSFTAPNAFFMPSVRNHFWDGKIRLLSLKTGKLYLGLHIVVKKFCEENEYDCVYKEPIDAESPFSVEEFQRMVAALKLSTDPGDGTGRVAITPHDYQERGIIHAIQAGRSLLLSPTASGKSLMMYILMRYYLAKTKGKILFIVPKTNLVQQLYKDFQDYATYIKWNVGENCHMICDGAEKETNKRVVISTWQALAVKEPLPKEYRGIWTKAQIKMWYKQAPYILEDSYFHQFETVFGDECHKFAAEDTQGGGELIEILSKCTHAHYRIGTTGTLKDSTIHHLILEGIFGEVYQTITTREMIDQKKAAELYIKCLQLQYPEAERKAMRKKTYQEEIEFLISHTSRNNFICNLALSLKGNTLVLFERVGKHGKILHQILEGKVVEGRRLFFVHGKVDTDERELVREITEKETNAIIVASYGTFSEGINLRNIHNIIFASPAKSKIRVLQSIGRGLRLSVTKTMMTLFDIADDLSVSNKAKTEICDNYGLQHLAERISFYVAEQFSYKMYRIQMQGVNDEGEQWSKSLT